MWRGVQAGLALLMVGAVTFGGSDSVARADGPDPESVYIQSISYGGSGCPQGSVGQAMANDRRSFTLTFDSFVASTGPGIPVTESRKSCHLDVNLKAPDGWSYAVVNLDTRGYEQAPAGVKVSSSFAYDFDKNVPGPQHPTAYTEARTGPTARDYVNSGDTPELKIDWSKCGGINALRIDASVQVDPSPVAAQITIDSVDGKVKNIAKTGGYQLTWKRCA